MPAIDRDALKRRARQNALDQRAYKRCERYINKAIAALEQAGFTENDTLIQQLKQAKNYIITT